MVHLSTKRVKMTKLQTYRFEIKFNFVTPLVDASAVFVYIGIGVRGNFQRGGTLSIMPESHLKMPEFTDFWRA